MIYHAKFLRRSRRSRKLNTERKWGIWKKLTRPTCALNYDIICWVEIPRLMSICETFNNLSIFNHGLPCGSNVFNYKSHTLHDRFGKNDKICSFGFQSTASSSPNHGKKESTSWSYEPKSEMMKKISTYLGDSRCSSWYCCVSRSEFSFFLNSLAVLVFRCPSLLF